MLNSFDILQAMFQKNFYFAGQVHSQVHRVKCHLNGIWAPLSFKTKGNGAHIPQINLLL